MSKVDILLVEDNDADVELVRLAFSENNDPSTIWVAHHGADALDFLYKRGAFTEVPTPAIILLDLNMPQIDGKQLLAMLKQDARLMSIPVLLLTSSRAQYDIQECYQLGANGYIVKPDDFAGMGAMVRQVKDFLFTMQRQSAIANG